MHAHRIVCLSLLSACSRGHDPPARIQRPPVADAVRADPAAAAGRPATPTSCAAACAAAAAQSCDKLAATCGYDTDRPTFVDVGGHVLHCKPACAAACVGHSTGIRMCVRQCLDVPGSSGGDPGDARGGS